MTSKPNKKYNNPFKATYKGISDLFKKQQPVGKLSDSDRIDGKKVLITGSSSGLGLATAKALAKRGGTVIMAVRSGIPEKGDEVKKYSGSERVFMHLVDLSDFNSIQNLVAEVRQKHGEIDILICNAAMVAKKGRKNKNGLEQMFVVNYLAKFILVNSLIKNDCFNKQNSTIPRIIFVSSESHRNTDQFDWKNFGKFEEFSIGKAVERYGYYKLLLTTYAMELERRLNPDQHTNYSVFVLCPGPVNSNIAREAPAFFQPLLKIVFKLFFRSPEKACEPVEYFAASPEMEGIRRDYLFLMNRKEVDKKASNPENGKKLWKKSEKLIADTGINIK